MNLGQRLRSFRGETISTKELDKLAGLTPGTVWSLEKSDSNNAQTKTLEPVCGVLGCTLDQLVLGTEPEPTREQIEGAVSRARAEHEARQATGAERAP
jgi:transcriptional regulator with XRE-family HTH domain